MTDFVPEIGVVKHKRQESGPSDVVFVETGGGRSFTPHVPLTAAQSSMKEGT